MYPQSHFLFPFVLGLVLHHYNILTIEQVFIASIIGVLIDLDHYLGFLYHYKDFNIKHVWNAAVVNHDPIERTFIHHKIGCAFITLKLIVIMLFDPIISLVIALGYYSHLFLDYVNLNIFRWKKVFTIIEQGWVVELPVHEVVFDVGLIFIIIYYFM